MIMALALPLVLLIYILGLDSMVGLPLMEEQYAFLALGLGLGTMWYRDRKWLAWAAVGIGTACSLLIYEFSLNQAFGPWYQKTPFLALLPFVLFSTWTRVSKAFTLLVGAFIVYGMFGHLVPGSLQGADIPVWEYLTLMTYDKQAIIGIPFSITMTIVFAFVLFGRTMQMGGVGDWINAASFRVLGRTRGGPAKIAVISSGLFGSFSGSAVANVITTGAITIPTMIRTGYSRVTACALEATASTMGQILPPVMGASAFIMAELTGTSYVDIATFALVPALVCYAILFAIVHFLGERVDIPGAPIIWADGVRYGVPVAILVYLALSFFPLDVAAIISVVVALFLTKRQGEDILDRTRKVLIKSGDDIGQLLVIAAGCGFIISTLDQSGLSFNLSYVLSEIGGSSMFLLLVLTAVACIVLGMGMPTASAYIIVALLIAPSLVELGIDEIEAHMFVLYYAVLSMVSPPVALAAFSASRIGEVEPMRVALRATLFAIPMAVIPFVWIYV